MLQTTLTESSGLKIGDDVRCNAAILFDSAEEDTRKNHPRLCGREIYLHAFEQFYRHKEIDCVFFLCRYDDSIAIEQEEMRKLERECGREIPLTVLHGIDSISKIWLHILQREREKPGVYVFHDIRYPMVTQEMISGVIRGAEEESVAVCIGREAAIAYPAAVRADSHILHRLSEPRKALQELADCVCGAYAEGADLFPVYDAGDTRKAESLLMKAD